MAVISSSRLKRVDQLRLRKVGNTLREVSQINGVKRGERLQLLGTWEIVHDVQV